MGFQTRRPEEQQEQQQQFTFTPHDTTPHDTTPPPTPPSADPLPTSSTDWRELRRQERTARRAERHAGGYSWVGGVVLILLGAIFLLQNTGLMRGFENWWALFILIPAASSFATAWRLYQQAGKAWTPAATGSLLGGLILSSLATLFLLGLDIGMWWPLFLIMGGLAILLGVRQWR